ncbi:MAG: uroporphyrinogen decarboxylase, partial [Oscillospiraceae bacterium]|nr:uroporphyrinogen decarboxylase [Oscillospiraceae bacterium]
MLTPRQNFYEAVKGGHPDRFVNQYEAIRLCMHPAYLHSASPKYGEENVVNAWGVTNSFPLGTPGAFPVHTPDKIVLKDIENWKDYVHAPGLDFPQEEWDMFRGVLDSVDTNLAYKAIFVAPGIFEMCHHLGEMSNTMMNLMLYEDEMHDLIKYITEYELKLAELICDKLQPDCIFHHDDWGSRTSTFMSPAMFEDFLVEPYKQVYGYYKDHGVELIVHHSDSYGATIVPAMIEMGIDVWQG